MSNRIPLELIEVETPCTQDWNRMRGSDQTRFCDHCNRDVYDLGAMTEADVQNLLCRQAGKLCVRFTRLANGKIQTLDYCPPSGRKGFGWKFWTLVGAVAAALAACGVANPRSTRTMGRLYRPPTTAPTTNPAPPPPCQTL